MGIMIYWIIVATVIILGQIMPQQGYRKKYYIWIMAIMHSFVCGFRYMYLTGDLRNYAADYYDFVNLGWFDESVFQGGRNFGFLWMMKFVSGITNENFQIFLLVVTIIIEAGVALLIFKYSPKPWLSYLVWNCMGFYIFGFSAIKQALAMAILMFAMICIFKKKPVTFLIFTLIAGTIHVPALAFLPAYWVCNLRLNARTISGYVVFAGIVFALRTNIVNLLSEMYYDETSFVMNNDTLGGGFFVIILILLCGLLLKGFTDRDFGKVYNLVIIAAIFQMFSGFDNVFTRLANYYLQFAILLIPMIFYDSDCSTEIDHGAMRAILPFNERSIKLIVFALTIILLWWYQRTSLGVTIEYEVDNYLNFRFMWNVIG